MTNVRKRLTAVALGLALAFAVVPAFAAPAPGAEADGMGRTPPRLSYADGDVFFWRPGAEGWTPAAINTPLAPGDELATGHPGNLELQVGARAFVRAWGDTQVGFVAQQPGVLHFRLASGHLALDVRGLEPGRVIQLDTPRAAFSVNAPGYYRAEADADGVSFATRAGGTATMTPAGGQPLTIGAEQQIVLAGPPSAPAELAAAPALDTWDEWNQARTDHLTAAVSGPGYVPSDVYGAPELDRYGVWSANPVYGPVWVPAGVPGGWVPYSTGRWVWDPYYSWTWVDSAPWGWAPYHYGRWVFLDGVWGWAPGPRVVRPVYAPALVAFFGGPGVRVGIGAPAVSWVALGWGEPLVPWWGPPRFAGRPWWGGWGGPRVVNNVIVHRTTVVKAHDIRTYRNAGVRNAMVAVPEHRFGRHAVQEARLAQIDTHRLQPVRGPLGVKPEMTRTSRPDAVAPPPLDRSPRRDASAPARRDSPWRERANAPRAAVPGPLPAPRVSPTPPPSGGGIPAPTPRVSPTRPPRADAPTPVPRVSPPPSDATPTPVPRVLRTPPPAGTAPPPGAGVRRPDNEQRRGQPEPPLRERESRGVEGNVRNPERGGQRPDDSVDRQGPGIRRQDWNSRRPDINVRRPERGVRAPDPGFRRPEAVSPRPEPRPRRTPGRSAVPVVGEPRNGPAAGGRR